MTKWHRKRIGHGPAVFQDLRELRKLRRTDDTEFGPSSLFLIALETRSGDMFVYLPPGSTDFAQVYDAEPCDPPNFEDGSLHRMSEEGHPAQPPARMVKAKGEVVEEPRFRAPDPARLARD